EGVPDEAEAVKRFRALLDESVEMQLMSDVPLGSHLSGGLDSSAIVLRASQDLADRLKTFSVYFAEKEYDESALIEEVSLLADTIHYDLLLDPTEFPKILPRILYHLDEPRVGPSVSPQWYIAEIASKEVRVVLTGHGGDELFAGYPAYIVPYLWEVWRRRDVPEAMQILRSLRWRLREEGWKRVVGLPLYALVNRELARYGHEAQFDDQEREALLVPDEARRLGTYDPRSELERVLARCDAGPINRSLYLDIKTYLPSLLLVEDRMSMAHSIEDRVPLLDHRIAELSAQIPGRFKIRGLTLKWIPRRSAEGVLPRSILQHRKVGFLVPLAEWLRGPLRGYLEEILLGERAASRGLFRPEAVRRLVRDHVMGTRDHAWKLWSLLNVELWHRIWLDGDGPETDARRSRPGEATRVRRARGRVVDAVAGGMRRDGSPPASGVRDEVQLEGDGAAPPRFVSGLTRHDVISGSGPVMKIHQVVPHFAPEKGGAETHVLGLARYLVGKGHEVVVHTSQRTLAGDALPANSTLDGIQIRQ